MAQSLAILIGAGGIWTVLRYLFGAVSYENFSQYAGVSLHTALGFVAFGSGVLFTRPAAGPMAIFSSDSASGAMARRILPMSLIMLIVVGAATATGLRMGLYDRALENALFTLCSIVLFISLVWRTAHEINKTEYERRRAIDAARAQREWLQVMLASIGDAVIATDAEGVVQFLNPVAERLIGRPESETVGRPAGDVLRLLEDDGVRPAENPVARGLRGGPAGSRRDHEILEGHGGVRTPVEDNAAPICDSRGRLLGCVVVFRDVTERRRAEEMRLEVSRQYEAMGEAIPQMIWTAQADGSADFFNKRWYDYTGREFAGSKGWLWQTCLHPEDGVVCGNRWRRSVVAGTGFEAEARIRRTDGVLRWHLIRALPVRDRNGTITKWFGTCTDIDDRKRAEESLRFLAEASTVLSASLDEIETLNGIAQLAVPRIADLCTVHLVIEDSLQLAAVSHMDPRKVDLMVRIDREFPPGGGLAGDAPAGKTELLPEFGEEQLNAIARNEVHRALLGELGLASIIRVPLPGHHDNLGAIVFASTSPGRRYTERDLELAGELGRRTALALDNNRLFAQVTETKEEAENANAAKDRFLAVLSHELRTPLTPVLLCVEELSGDTSQAPELRAAMKMIRRNIELEARMIDDLLDITRIQRGKLRLQRTATDVHALLRNSIEICGAGLRDKNLRVSLGLSSAHHWVDADPARLQQVFWNIIKNAIKFTDAGGSIVFRSSNRTRRGMTRIQIQIEDTGIGIEPAFLSRIFDPFEQGERSRSRGLGGLGLGLAISKNLMDAHGGSIAVESPGHDLGSTFTIELDTIPAPDDARAGARPATESNQTAGVRILLVEDNCDTGGLLRKILQRRGYHVDLATTMECALSMAGHATYDLLVSDVGLPDGNGLELMRRLRETRAIPGIAMSGFGMDEDIRRSREAGFSDHLTKPIGLARLEDAIEKAIRGSVDDAPAG